jgi:hypothetical protein
MTSCLSAPLVLLAGLHLSAAAAAPPPGVCDIFLSGGAPCVAAFSLSRALFAAFDGPLYRVRNNATNATRDVGVVSAGGIADVAAQERFCGAALCVVEAIYDQSPGANHLGREKGFAFLPPPRNSQDAGVNLTAQSRVSLAGHPVYSAVFDSHCDVGSGRSCDGLQAGYSNRTAQGTAVGDEPQTVYALFDGRHYNTGCCFEFGNAEKNETRLSGSMEAASVRIFCARRAQVSGGRRRSAAVGNSGRSPRRYTHAFAHSSPHCSPTRRPQSQLLRLQRHARAAARVRNRAVRVQRPRAHARNDAAAGLPPKVPAARGLPPRAREGRAGPARPGDRRRSD